MFVIFVLIYWHVLAHKFLFLSNGYSCNKALDRLIGKILDLKPDSGSVFHLSPLRFGEYVPC